MGVFNIINVIIEVLIILMFSHMVFKIKRQVKNIFKILLVVAAVCVLSFTGYLHLYTAFNLAVSFCIFFLLSVSLYGDELKKILFMDTLYEVIVIIADVLAANIMTFSGIEYKMIGLDDITFIIGAVLSNVIRLCLLALVGKRLSKYYHSLPALYLMFLLVCPVMSVACMVIFDYYLMGSDNVNVILVFIPSVYILCINFMIFWFFDSFSKQLRLKTVEELAISQEENYKILQNSESELRKLRHDMNNHLMMLGEYLKNDDIETAAEHLNNINQTLNAISATVCTNNPAIDAAINIGARKAQSQNIDYKTQIIGDAKVNIGAADICMLLSNAIDNAIEACGACEAKYVYIELNISRESIKIHIENTTVIKSRSIRFFTTKKDIENHGYGTKNMKSVVRKYNGNMEHKIENGIFFLDIMLCCGR